ncbi:inositol hexakisphosphate and diphosphoinositol-pentakisphosphate kinase [Entomophthora muscae]|uniref:Inositol hexakisphosphate and diphosphoinositol-pentakisphosphate kinase n=1 Tax=Entomophthora muscae TaxID=34485 RepID=A0ACC2TQD7_9FUNG|nr:inositol hexakisphosphate and diphosphoinositol-pentakisphosphate kinase [Entomophthora muscae]
MQNLLSGTGSYRGFFEMPPSNKKKFVVGVCAIDVKARSKPMRNILNRFLENEDFDVVIFRR